jgi:hypothetical protein
MSKVERLSEAQLQQSYEGKLGLFPADLYVTDDADISNSQLPVV